MGVISLVGDCTTTTSLALASIWRPDDEIVIVEADRSGGSLAAWLDTPATPSLSTIVANSRPLDGDATTAWSAIRPMIHQGRSGISFIAAPVRSREASRAIDEAEVTLFPLLARLSTTTLVDIGRCSARLGVPAIVTMADVVVVCHRQDSSSPAAATVRIERLAEIVENLSPIVVPVVLIVIGDRPFDGEEIGRFVASGLVSGEGNLSLSTHCLAVDDLAAAVLAGRTGVSRRRLARLPLMRDVRTLGRVLEPLAAPVAPLTPPTSTQVAQTPPTQAQRGVS